MVHILASIAFTMVALGMFALIAFMLLAELGKIARRWAWRMRPDLRGSRFRVSFRVTLSASRGNARRRLRRCDARSALAA